jgi:hypothetical protein
MPQKISEITRRDLWEVLADVQWWGRLDEIAFLKRLYSLDFLPSTDNRRHDAEGDIFQHRVANNDWADDWVFSDDRFELANGPDETLLKFLSEMLHPAVRKPEEAARLASAINPLLRADGYQVVPTGAVSGRPVYGWETIDADPADPDVHFTKDLRPLMATLAELAEHGGDEVEREVLKVARAKLEEPEYDSWDGGTYYYTLKLVVPPAVFARLGNRLNEMEQHLSTRVGQVHRGTDRRRITAVVIQPGQVSAATREGSTAVDVGPLTFWTPNHFKLFLSHVSTSKQRAAALRQALSKFHISAFVAHETIDPGELWQREIEKALRTMDALAAIVTPDFHGSNWTDQEIGFALGRDVYVLPIRKGKDPYGFLGEVQGLQGEGKFVPAVADEVFLALTRHQRTRERMHEVLVKAFEESAAGYQAVGTFKLIERAGSFSKPLLRRLEAAATNNRNVASISARVKQMASAR